MDLNLLPISLMISALKIDISVMTSDSDELHKIMMSHSSLLLTSLFKNSFQHAVLC